MARLIAMNKVKSKITMRVTELRLADETLLRKLAAFGILPGVEIELLQTYPTYVIRVGYTQVALDCEIAKYIMVTV